MSVVSVILTFCMIYSVMGDYDDIQIIYLVNEICTKMSKYTIAILWNFFF